VGGGPQAWSSGRPPSAMRPATGGPVTGGPAVATWSGGDACVNTLRQPIDTRGNRTKSATPRAAPWAPRRRRRGVPARLHPSPGARGRLPLPRRQARRCWTACRRQYQRGGREPPPGARPCPHLLAVLGSPAGRPRCTATRMRPLEIHVGGHRVPMKSRRKRLPWRRQHKRSTSCARSPPGVQARPDGGFTCTRPSSRGSPSRASGRLAGSAAASTIGTPSRGRRPTARTKTHALELRGLLADAGAARHTNWEPRSSRRPAPGTAACAAPGDPLAASGDESPSGLCGGH